MPKILTAALLAFLCAIAPVVSAQATPKHQQIGPPRYSPSSSLSSFFEPEDAGVGKRFLFQRVFKLGFPFACRLAGRCQGPFPGIWFTFWAGLEHRAT